MATERPGCYYCFRTFDPQDTSEAYRTFVKCTQCGTLYHEVCFRQNNVCFRCEQRETELVTIKPPHSLYAIHKPVMLPIKASTIAYSVAGKEFVVPAFIFTHAIPILRLVYRKSVVWGRKLFYEYLVPGYHEHILPALQRLQERIKNRG